jgi:predicted transcriptional regulator
MNNDLQQPRVMDDNATGNLFDNVNGRLVPRGDVCVRKHGGNPQSTSAFETIDDIINVTQERILKLIAGCRDYGLTLDELSGITGRPPNAISGRITELRIMGKIEKRGTRKTRSGCSAAVWVAI